jgi:hypothetical protein
MAIYDAGDATRRNRAGIGRRWLHVEGVAGDQKRTFNRDVLGRSRWDGAGCWL